MHAAEPQPAAVIGGYEVAETHAKCEGEHITLLAFALDHRLVAVELVDERGQGGLRGIGRHLAKPADRQRDHVLANPGGDAVALVDLAADKPGAAGVYASAPGVD